MDRRSSDWPAEFVCPIAKSVMADPVIVSTGESYERRCIEAWFELGQTMCVKKGAPLERGSIFPNDNLRNAIDNHARSRGIKSLPRPPSREVALHYAHSRMLEIQGTMAAAATGGPGIYQEEYAPGIYQQGEYGFSTMDDYSSEGPWRNEFIQRESGSRVHHEPGIRSDLHRSSGGSGRNASVSDYSMYSAGLHDQYWGMMPNMDWMNDDAPIANYQEENDHHHHLHEGNDETDLIHRPRIPKSEKQQKRETAPANSPSPPSDLCHGSAEEAMDSSGRSPSRMNVVAMAYSTSMPRASTAPWQETTGSEEDVVAEFPIPLVTRPSSYADEILLQQQQPPSAGNPSTTSPTITSQYVESLAACLVQPQRQASAMAEVRRLTRISADNRLRLCDSVLIQAILPLLQLKPSANSLHLLWLEKDTDKDDIAMAPTSSPALIDAVAAVANLSIEKPNKVKLVREGVVPRLIDLLTMEGINGDSELEEARNHAAGAIFGLAMEEENMSFLGVIGVIPPLLELLRRSIGSSRGSSAVIGRQKAMESQKDTVLALYQLSLQRMNASKIAKYPGAVSLLLDLAETPETPRVAAGSLHVLHNVASCPDGHKELLQLKALKRLVNLMEDRKLSSHRSSSGSNPKTSGSAESMLIAEQAASVLLILSKGSCSSFWFLVRRSRGTGRPPIEEVLQNLAHRGSPRAQKKASALLERMRQMMNSVQAASPSWESAVGHDDDQEFGQNVHVGAASSTPLYNNHHHNVRSRWNAVGTADEQTNHSSAF